MSRNRSSYEFFIITYNIYFFVEDVDIKYMSIYKEENNKKDCFEHLISLQDCDHNSHTNAECTTREQECHINGARYKTQGCEHHETLIILLAAV